MRKDTFSRFAIGVGAAWMAASASAASSERQPLVAGTVGRLNVSTPIEVTADVSKRPFSADSQPCGARFVAHKLAHTTVTNGADHIYDGNGTGTAVGDLDNDGDLDIVAGNLKGPASVLWNDGGFRFTRTALVDPDSEIPETTTRSLTLVDADLDGRLDIMATHTRGGIAVWKNQGRRVFTQDTFGDVNVPAFAVRWDDLEGSGELDLITSSYDTVLEAEAKDSFLLSGGGGTVLYRSNSNRPGQLLTLRPTRLTRQAQALALTVIDTNGDGRRDIIVGNDFGVPDEVWTRSATRRTWVLRQPFQRITRNTMSYAIADVDRNSHPDLFAGDMKPNFNDRKSIAAWLPLMQKSFERLQRSDRQRAENVLQMQFKAGSFHNAGYKQGIDATGWSWSAQFGDLDRDGFEDLYIVNGMIHKEVFAGLKNHELVEKNRSFRNDRGRFRPADWSLDSTAGGRSMAMADFNNDGRLDIVVNNLGSPSVVYENRLCGGAAITIDLVWDGVSNRQALGAKAVLETAASNGASDETSSRAPMQRTVESSSGYLTGTPTRLHFPVPEGERQTKLTIIWPDGTVSNVQSPEANTHLVITRRGTTSTKGTR
jgi:enediyne biosynthesis protein E4